MLIDILENQQIDLAAKTLQQEIDAEVFREILKISGWHEVVLSYTLTYEQSSQIDKWIECNTKNRSWTHGLVWLFECSKDAVLFGLVWA